MAKWKDTASVNCLGPIQIPIWNMIFGRADLKSASSHSKRDHDFEKAKLFLRVKVN